jgi:hypothetical protein
VGKAKIMPSSPKDARNVEVVWYETYTHTNIMLPKAHRISAKSTSLNTISQTFSPMYLTST